MQLGRHLRELWRLRLGLVLCLALASAAALVSVARVGLLPPSLHPRELQMATASTRVLVEGPTSSVLDLTVDTYNFESLKNRGLLVGNVMASGPVRSYIGRRAGVAPQRLDITGPITQDFPRPLASSVKRRSGDLLKLPDQLRLSIQANPTVPMLDIYAEAPTAAQARKIANGAVDGMNDYLRDLGSQQQVTADHQVRLDQLGRATGAVINPTIDVEVVLLSFLLTFGVSSAAVLFLARVRRGWALEGQRA